jgi:asparagine synthetase B (glutamine-hydrolysing)
MCGFIFTYTKKEFTEKTIVNANTYIQHRGPTATNKLHIKSLGNMYITMLHNLLDISGESILQPLSFNGNHLLFNGEIYNYLNIDNVSSDTLALMKFIENGFTFKDGLDGEFVIASYSENSQILQILTDPFLTKPLYFGRSDDPCEFACASYPSALNALGFNHIYDAQPNTKYSVNLAKGSISIAENYPIHKFDSQQISLTYDNWCDAFIEAVRKRALHGGHHPMVALSSGYDSGCISLALKLLNIKFNAYTMQSGENIEIIKQRYGYYGDTLDKNILIDSISKKEISTLKMQAGTRIENLNYHHNDGNGPLQMLSDPGAVGSYIIAKRAAQNGEIVNLSGSGGDEIYSDYAFQGKKHSQHSEFGGVFPENMEGFFPWKKFYGDTQRSYLMKEEFIFGAFGIESRYPFLDRSVVGEFLKLDPELKNKYYKFPFELNSKRGFAIRKPPIGRRIKQNIGNLFK